MAATAVLAAVVATRPAHEAATERDRWGELVTVVVARTDVAAGAALDPSRVEERRYPLAVVPDGAVDGMTAGEVAVARRPIGAGEIVTRADVSPRDGPTALAAPRQVVVAVRETVLSDVRVGDRVLVAAEGVVLAEDATVAGTRDDVVMLAVDRDAAPMVAAAAAGSVGVSLLLVP